MARDYAVFAAAAPFPGRDRAGHQENSARHGHRFDPGLQALAESDGGLEARAGLVRRAPLAAQRRFQRRTQGVRHIDLRNRQGLR